MKLLITTLLLLIGSHAFTQDLTRFAIQGMVELSSREQAETVAELIREDLHCPMVRIDHSSNRFFLLIDLVNRPTSTQIRSLLNNYLGNPTCIQIQEYGVEPLAVYPFTNCEND